MDHEQNFEQQGNLSENRNHKTFIHTIRKRNYWNLTMTEDLENLTLRGYIVGKRSKGKRE